MVLHLESDVPKITQEKYLPPEQVSEKVASLRKDGKTIVTLNGCFDLLHVGHTKILTEAKEQGDILIVALNVDARIQESKGPMRPLTPLKHRLQMLSMFFCVDYVTWFAEKDPVCLLERIKPDVHVNGSDWGENCLEAPVVKKHGGRIHIVTLQPGQSTTNIVGKIADEMCRHI